MNVIKGFFLAALVATASALYNDFRIGAGIYDVTGPVTNVQFMGMGMMNQVGKGLHFRLYARAFVVESVSTQQRTIYMSADLCMIFGHIHDAVVQKVQALYPNYGYSRANILLHGTHTHSGPGGFSMHPLYDATTYGYHKDNAEAIVTGIVNAIVMAHNRMSKGGRILINQGELLNANTNRGLWAYEQNPLQERLNYPYNVDKTMVLLRLQDETGADIGSINWFAVHGTSMFNDNHLVSGDNKGYASYLFERAVNGWNVPAGRGPFVAAFGQSNEGDVSPNIKGAFCTMPASVAGQPCDPVHSTCAGKNEGCQGQGPYGRQDFLNTQAIGERQAIFAQALWNNATIPLSTAKFGFIQTNIDMSAVTVDPKFTISGKEEYTCPGGLGDSFAAGTTDGPGAFNFVEGTGDNNTNPYWNWIGQHIGGGILGHKPDQKTVECQLPKRILLFLQGYQYPCQWSASVLPLQIFQWGQMVIIAVPGEFTSMAGRRLRNTVRQAFVDAGAYMPGMTFSIAGLANDYSHYIATYEEYSAQRYAGASTLFGPHTLEAYQQEFYKLAYALAKGEQAAYPPGPPLMQCNKTFSFLPPVVEDTAPDGKFGSIAKDNNSTYTLDSVVNVTFWGSDLRSNLFSNSTYLTVERKTSSGGWQVVLDDADFETRLYWERDGISRSLVTCSWHIPATYGPVAQSGATYRIGLQAVRKQLLGSLHPYQGYGSPFTLQ